MSRSRLGLGPQGLVYIPDFPSVGTEKCTVCTLFSVCGTDITCFRHLFSLNKWQYRDEYIIVIVVLQEKMEKIRLKNCKKVT